MSNQQAWKESSQFEALKRTTEFREVRSLCSKLRRAPSVRHAEETLLKVVVLDAGLPSTRTNGQLARDLGWTPRRVGTVFQRVSDRAASGWQHPRWKHCNERPDAFFHLRYSKPQRRTGKYRMTRFVLAGPVLEKYRNAAEVTTGLHDELRLSAKRLHKLRSIADAILELVAQHPKLTIQSYSVLAAIIGEQIGAPVSVRSVEDVVRGLCRENRLRRVAGRSSVGRRCILLSSPDAAFTVQPCFEATPALWAETDAERVMQEFRQHLNEIISSTQWKRWREVVLWTAGTEELAKEMFFVAAQARTGGLGRAAAELARTVGIGERRARRWLKSIQHSEKWAGKSTRGLPMGIGMEPRTFATETSTTADPAMLRAHLRRRFATRLRAMRALGRLYSPRPRSSSQTTAKELTMPTENENTMAVEVRDVEIATKLLSVRARAVHFFRQISWATSRNIDVLNEPAFLAVTADISAELDKWESRMENAGLNLQDGLCRTSAVRDSIWDCMSSVVMATILQVEWSRAKIIRDECGSERADWHADFREQDPRSLTPMQQLVELAGYFTRIGPGWYGLQAPNPRQKAVLNSLPEGSLRSLIPIGLADLRALEPTFRGTLREFEHTKELTPAIVQLMLKVHFDRDLLRQIRQAAHEPLNPAAALRDLAA